MQVVFLPVLDSVDAANGGAIGGVFRMMKPVSTGTESKSYNIVLSGVKRDAKKAITTFAVTVDDKAYSYPKDSCPK